ncbi:MAG: cytochrome P450 [Proteobacteria bacterium]|nr:cytochrome P450 [Pseudomonadota bacterium]
MSASFPPGPSARFPGELLLRSRRDNLQFLIELARDFGDVAGLRMGRERIVLVNHPDAVRDVLVTHQKNFLKGKALERARIVLGNGLLTNEGEDHLRQRRMMQPAFHRERIASYAAAMVARAATVRDRWRDGEAFDAHQAMMALTLAIVGQTLFSADVEDEATEIGAALTTVLGSFNRMMLPWSRLLFALPLPSSLRFHRARRRLDATIYRLIAERRASGADAGDLLSMMLLATDTEGDGGGMTDRQLRDEAMTLFLAGHETTANALTWAWYLLARNAEVERRMQAEVDALGHEPTFDDLPRLEYTRRVVAETMRLYPPAYAIGRRAVDAYTVGEYELPARTIVIVSPYLVHRDPRWWSDPERFDPDRWLPEQVATRPKFSYFPFGAGTRICIGEQFAWTEAVLVLATIAQRWRLWLAPKQRIALYPQITLRPRYGIRMVATRR